MTEKKAYLYLDSERFFEGFSVGKNADTCGEVVFNTSMSGYQEIISEYYCRCTFFLFHGIYLPSFS